MTRLQMETTLAVPGDDRRSGTKCTNVLVLVLSETVLVLSERCTVLVLVIERGSEDGHHL